MTDNIIDWDDTPGSSGPGETVIIHERNPDDEVATLVQVDSTGQEIVTELNFTSPELTEADAREITERIKTTTNVLYLLVKRAHAGKAYKALGYATFADYVKAEFNFSKVYAYRLLNQANFIEAIEAKVPEGTEIYISEPVSTKLKKVLPELLSEIEQRVDPEDDPDHVGAVIDDIIRERQDRKEANDFLADENDEELPDMPMPAGTGSSSNSSWDDDDDTDAYDTDMDDDDDDAIDTNDVRRKFDKIYNLYSGLRHITTVGEGDELIPFLPKERWDEFNDLLGTVIPWLTDFKTKFDTFLQQQNDTADDEDSDSVNDPDDEDF